MKDKPYTKVAPTDDLYGEVQKQLSTKDLIHNSRAKHGNCNTDAEVYRLELDGRGDTVVEVYCSHSWKYEMFIYDSHKAWSNYSPPPKKNPALSRWR